MSSDVVLSNLCPIGTPESESGSSTSTTASDTGSALDIGSIRLPIPISSDSDSDSYVSSNKLPSNPMTSSNETRCSSGSPTNGRASTSPTSSSATARGMSHPLRRLGRLIKAYLTSDLLTGVLALVGFLGTLLVGLWGVILTRKQLDLGEWTFCKSYPNDTQVLSSATCQRYAGKPSLDYITKQENEAALSTYGSLDLNLSFLYMSERIPHWIYTPPAADRSSCSIICHPHNPPLQVSYRNHFWLPIYSSQDACAELNQIFLLHASIQATLYLLLCCYKGLAQLWPGISLKKVLVDIGRTILADLYLWSNELAFVLSWYCFSSILTILVAHSGSYSSDGLTASTFLKLVIFQVLTAFTSILLMNVLFRHFQFHPISEILHKWIQGLRCVVSFLPQHWFLQGFVLFAVSMLRRNITVSAYCAFILDLGSRYNRTLSQIKLQETRTHYPDNPETSAVFNEAGTQEQGQYINTRATDATTWISGKINTKCMQRDNTDLNQPLQRDGGQQVAAYVSNSGPSSSGKIDATTSSTTTTLEISGSLEQPGLSNRVRNISNQPPMEKVTVDPRFKIHSSEGFKPGQVFKTMWSEPVDNYGNDTGEAKWSRDLGHPYLRRFVIRRSESGHSECLPVVNYNPAGSRKASLGVELLEQDYYAVIYAGQPPPELSKSELALRRSPIRILPNTPEDKLPLGSWINYAKKYTIEHNVNVVFIGSIAPDSQLIFDKDFDLIWSKKSS